MNRSSRRVATVCVALLTSLASCGPATRETSHPNAEAPPATAPTAASTTRDAGSDAAGSSAVVTLKPGCSRDDWCELAAPPATSIADPVLRGLAVFGPESVYGFEEQGRVWHHDGSTWTEAFAFPKPYQQAIWGSAPDDLWVAVAGPTIARFDGRAWKTSNVGKETIRAIWGTAKNQVWLAADDGVVHAFDGRRFRATKIAPMTVYAGHGTGPSHIVLAGPEGTAIWNGKQALFHAAPKDPDYGTGYFCVWTAGPDFTVAAGYGGVLVRYDAASSYRESPGTRGKLWDVWGTSKDDVFVVGEQGVIFHYDGQRWTREDSGTTTNLFAIHGTATHIVVAGSQRLWIKRRPH